MNNWKRCKELEKRKPVRKREFYSRGSKVSQIMEILVPEKCFKRKKGSKVNIESTESTPK